jgi:hypothetical protein
LPPGGDLPRIAVEEREREDPRGAIWGIRFVVFESELSVVLLVIGATMNIPSEISHRCHLPDD